MHFPALLTALFIDQVIWNGPAHRHFHWLRDYLAWWFSQPLSRPAQDSGWAALVPLLPLVLVLGWLQFGLIQAAGPFPGYAFGALVLLFSLGPEDASRDVQRFFCVPWKRATWTAHSACWTRPRGMGIGNRSRSG